MIITKEVVQAAFEIEDIIHDFTYEDFKNAVVYALYSAAKKVEHLQDKSISQKYYGLGHFIEDYYEPHFPKEYIEK